MAWTSITWLLALLVLAIAIFISTASFSRKETVRGRLRPTTAEARVFATDAGTVSKLYVRLGQEVAAGVVVAEITTQRHTEGGTSLSAETLETLKSQERALQSRREMALRTSSLERRRISIEMAQAQASLENYKEKHELASNRVAIAEDRLRIAQTLFREGAASSEERRVREDALMSQRQQLLDLANLINQTGAQLQTRAVELSRIDEDLARDVSDIDQRLAQISSQEAQAKASAGYVIRTPLAGRVAALQVEAGERVDPSQPILTVLPIDAQLIAEVYVPSRAIAFVSPGQQVRVLFDAFPYQKFGAADGIVSTVSQTTLSPKDLRAPIPIQEASYRVTIALADQSIAAFGKAMPLRAGMELSADIILERRKLVEWLLEPLYATGLRMQGAGSNEHFKPRYLPGPAKAV